MRIIIILFLILLALYLGIGIGTIMRFNRRLQKNVEFAIIIIVPIFAACGFVIWTNELRKDLGTIHGGKLSYIRYIYKVFVKAMPSLCEDCATVIIAVYRKKVKQNAKKYNCTQKNDAGLSIPKKAEFIFKNGYNYALADQKI